MKKGVKILIAIIAVIVVLGGVAAGLFFTGVIDYLKPARKTWSKQVQKALDLDGIKVTDYADIMEEYKDLYDKPFTAKFDISANLQISELDKDVQKTINNSKIKIESAQNVKEKNGQVKIALESDDSKILDVDFVTNGTKMGIASEDLYDKYLTVSLEDLEDYMKENNSSYSDELPESVESITEMYNKMGELNAYDLLYVSKDDLKTLQKTYKKVVENSIDKKAYTKKANVKVEVDGKDVSTTGYYLTLSGEDASKLVEDLADAVVDDETLNNIIVDKANVLLDSMGEDKISSKELKEYIKMYADELKKYSGEALNEYKDQGIQIAVYSKLSKPVRLEVNYIEDIDDIYNAKTLLSIEYGKGKDIYTIMPEEEQSFVIENKYSKKTDKEKVGTLTFTMTGSGSSIELGTIDYEIINKDTEKKIVLNASISKMVARQANLNGEISVRIEFSEKGNYKKEPVDVHFSLEGKYGEESAKINVDGTIDYSGDVSITKLDSDNSINVMKLSSTEQEELADKIMKKASEVLPDRLKKIGVNVKAEDIYNPNALKTNITTSGTGTTAIKEADEVITGKKIEKDDTLGEYTQIIQIGYKGEKIVAVSVAMEFDDESTAAGIVSILKLSTDESFKDVDISQDGKRVVMAMDAETFKKQVDFSDEDITKDSIKAALKDDGYTVE